MKGTEHFKEIIKGYLEQRAKEDELFRAKYETTTRTIDDVVTFILNEVQKSGCCGFADDEIYSLAVHCIDEPELEIGKPQSCNVVVNHHVELTEEEKAEQRALALKRYQAGNCASCRHATIGRNLQRHKRTNNTNRHFLTIFEP